jgi:GAF domain-containing protein
MKKIQKQDVAALTGKMESFALSVEDPYECAAICFAAIIATFQAERGFVLVFENKEGAELSAYLGQGVDPDNLFITEEISQTIINSVVEDQKPLFTTNAMEDPRFSTKISVLVSGIRSVLCVPLLSSPGFFGILYLDNRFSTYVYTAEDRDLLVDCAKTFSRIMVRSTPDLYYRPLL